MPTAALLPTAALVTVLAMAQAPGDPHTIAQTEPLAVRALAALLKVDPAAITVVRGEETTWPDAAFGCAPRKGVFEPQPTPGYRFTLRYGGVTYDYRSDRNGHVRRCVPEAGRKPPAPVRR